MFLSTLHEHGHGGDINMDMITDIDLWTQRVVLYPSQILMAYASTLRVAKSIGTFKLALKYFCRTFKTDGVHYKASMPTIAMKKHF